MLIKSVLFLIFGCVLVAAQTRQQLEQQYAGEKCIRDCSKGDSRVCYYHWTLEHYHTMGPACGRCGTGSNADCYNEQCIAADGVPRGVMSINRKIPGPPIHVCHNDMIVVDVLNAMGGTSAAIHWHGLLQRESPWMDGVPFITQCPIDFSTTFRYAFKASEPGTQWYHSHAGHHKSNGEFGGLVVRRPKSEELNAKEYDDDLPDHLMIISDWDSTHAEHQVPGIRQNPNGVLHDNFLFNGRGVRRNGTNRANVVANTPLEVFRVKKGRRYRFRLINAMSHVCPISLEVEKHSLTVIASDSFDVQPATVESLISNSGERYDFVINANQNSGKFWIRVKGLGPCEGLLMEQHAILSYDWFLRDEALAFNNPSPPAYASRLNILKNRQLNHPLTVCGEEDVSDDVDRCITDLSSYELGRGIVDVPYDHQFFLGFNNLAQDKSKFFSGKDYIHYMSIQEDVLVGAINTISFVAPSTPLITSQNQLSNFDFCTETSRPAHCRTGEVCHCLHRIQVKLNSIVELIIVDEVSSIGLINHPFHLHGHKLFVTGIGQNLTVPRMTTRIAQDMVNRHEIKTRFGENEKFPIKDTISIPSKGFTRFRFKADNPGFWLLHCHFDWHLAIGMGLVLQVGEPNQMLKPPQGFPTCGNYMPNVNVPNANRPNVNSGFQQPASRWPSWPPAFQ